MAGLAVKPAAITWVIVAINLGVLVLYIGVHTEAISEAVPAAGSHSP